LIGTALVFWLALRLHAGKWVATLTALFFAIHPLHVESVAWVSGRKDVLYVPLFVGGLIAYTYARAQLRRSRQITLWLLTFVLFVLSCLAKPAAIVFPAALWLVDAYLEPKQTFSPKKLWMLLPFVAVSGIFAWLTVQYQTHVGAVAQQYGLSDRLLFSAYGLVIYPFKLLFPFGLSAFHPAPDPGSEMSAALRFAPIGALLFLGAMVWCWVKQYRLAFFACAFFLVNVALVLGLIKVGMALHAERYTYLAYFGFFMLLGTGAAQWWQRGGALRWAGVMLCLALTGLFAWQTNRQIPVWRNSETLWNQIVAEYPVAKCYAYRGYHYYTQQQWAKALADFDAAYAQEPDNETTMHIRAICLERMGQKEEALKAYTAYEQRFPPKADAQFQAANLYNALKNYPEAIARYKKAVQLEPRHIDAWNNLGNAYFNEKNYADAEAAFSKTLEINDKFIPGLNNRGAARLNMGRKAEALTDFDRSLSLNPNQPDIAGYREIAKRK
jgi:Tfp pilus assembly protein PilF